MDYMYREDYGHILYIHTKENHATSPYSYLKNVLSFVVDWNINSKKTGGGQDRNRGGRGGRGGNLIKE